MDRDLGFKQTSYELFTFADMRLPTNQEELNSNREGSPSSMKGSGRR